MKLKNIIQSEYETDKIEIMPDRFQILRYKPEIRFVVRLEYNINCSYYNNNYSVIARLEKPEILERIYNISSSLETCLKNDRNIYVPRPLSYKPEIGLLIVEDVEGTPFNKGLFSELSEDYVRLASKALGK